MKNILKAYIIFIIVIILTLLIVHTFSINDLVVNNVSVFLVIILIFVPFITAIKKFKWGDFEAEVEIKEINKIQKSVEKTVSSDKVKTLEAKSIVGYTEKEVLELFDYLIELSDIDPVLSIAKLRVELEKLIRGIFLHHKGDKKRIHSISYMTNYLIKKDDFDSQEFESAKMIIDVSNQVIHGKKINNAEAKIILLSAAKLLGFITGYSNVLSFDKNNK